MIVLFTDLDGTLLDRSAYSAEPAREALRRASELGVPVVFCSSKTRAEVEYWRDRLDNCHPFIVENGGALYVPLGYFAAPFHAPVYRDGYAIFEFGTPYDQLVAALQSASQSSGCRAVGFHDLSPEEISRRYQLPRDQARLAKIREYDEPFEILDQTGAALLAAIQARGFRWTRGGRLHHITGINNKAHCVCLLSSYYYRIFGSAVTVGLGDGMNDIGFLKSVDFPVIVRSEAVGKLQQVLPRARVTALPGPAGWNRAVLGILEEFSSEPNTGQSAATV